VTEEEYEELEQPREPPARPWRELFREVILASVNGQECAVVRTTAQTTGKSDNIEYTSDISYSA